MRIAFYFLMSATIFFQGCITTHVDSVVRFSISGIVIDKANQQPIEHVKVVFKDIGLDKVHSKSDISNVVGNSDPLGKINIVFNYWWGADKGLFKKKPPMTFEIILILEQYKSEKRTFSLTEIPFEGNTYRVSLGNISLEALR